MKLSLGFSPCPNDTFIFDAMVHNKIDTEGLEFDVILGDVEELNTKKYTTANFLLSLAFPNAKNKKETLFSDIENDVIHNRVDLGLIIHENRFTYHERGLKKIIDLGEYWENKTKLPIPLGGIVVQRSLPLEIQQKVNRVMRRSVEYALANPEQTLDYVKPHAQEMETSVMMKHIGLYVNDYTVDLGEKGKAAVKHLFDTGKELEIVPDNDLNLFLL